MLWKGYILYADVFCDGLLGSLYLDWYLSTATKDTVETTSTHEEEIKHSKKRRITFADAEGLPLTEIRRLSITDTSYTPGMIVPKIDNRAPTTNSTKTGTSITRSFKFTQPASSPDFMNRVSSQQISLESVSLNNQGTIIHGSVRVSNIAYDKEVVVRWTRNNWLSFRESQCLYCNTSDNRVTDRFAFSLILSDTHSNVEFIIRYKVNGAEYWDNNNEQNYILSSDSN